MCTASQNMVLDCNDGKGGIKTIYLANFTQADEPLMNASGVVTSWASATGNFYTYQLKPEVGNAPETPQTNDQNGTSYYDHNVSGKINKQTGLKHLEMKKIVEGRFYIIVKDANERYWLYGRKNGMTWVAGTAWETGTAMGDFNGYNFAFASKEEVPKCEISSSLIASLLAA